MAKKRTGAPDAENEFQVTLKPLFGIAPERYLPVFYGILLLVILFFILVFPGLRNYGSVLHVATLPEGASVYVDGVREGATPLAVFVPAGTHDLTLKRPHFADATEKIDVKGKLFATLIWPRHEEVNRTLSLGDAKGLLSEAALRYSQWSLVRTASSQYQFPPVLSPAVRDYYTGNRNAAVSDVDALLSHAVEDLNSDVLLRDYSRAAAFNFSHAQAPGPFQVGQMIAGLARMLDQRPGFAFQLAQVLPEKVAATYTGSSWFQNFRQNYTTALLPYTSEGDSAATEPTRVITAAGERFHRIPAGTFVEGMKRSDRRLVNEDPLSKPRPVRQPSFYVMESEVTRASYARFIGAVPEWSWRNRDALVKKGLVTSDYLSGWDSPSFSRDSSVPVTNVSYFAAQAYARWVTGRLPSTLSGYHARLPLESEWEWAADYNGSVAYPAVFQDSTLKGAMPVASANGGRLGIYDLMGNVWEWSQNWYHPASYLQGSWPYQPQVSEPFDGAQRAVRGGSWANDRETIGLVTRGSQPPDWCTPFLGFRLVLVTE